MSSPEKQTCPRCNFYLGMPSSEVREPMYSCPGASDMQDPYHHDDWERKRLGIPSTGQVPEASAANNTQTPGSCLTCGATGHITASHGFFTPVASEAKPFKRPPSKEEQAEIDKYYPATPDEQPKQTECPLFCTGHECKYNYCGRCLKHDPHRHPHEHVYKCQYCDKVANPTAQPIETDSVEATFTGEAIKLMLDRELLSPHGLEVYIAQREATARLEASFIELDLLEQAINAGRDMNEYKLARLKALRASEPNKEGDK